MPDSPYRKIIGFGNHHLFYNGCTNLIGCRINIGNLRRNWNGSYGGAIRIDIDVHPDDVVWLRLMGYTVQVQYANDIKVE